MQSTVEGASVDSLKRHATRNSRSRFVIPLREVISHIASNASASCYNVAGLSLQQSCNENERGTCTGGIKNDDCNAASGFKPEIT